MPDNIHIEYIQTSAQNRWTQDSTDPISINIKISIEASSINFFFTTTSNSTCNTFQLIAFL